MTTMAEGVIDDTRLNDRVAMEIKLMLTRKGWSQARLARELGMSGAWLSGKISGRTPFDLDDLQRISTILGVPASKLLATVALLGVRTRRSDKPANRHDSTRPAERRVKMLRSPR